MIKIYSVTKTITKTLQIQNNYSFVFFNVVKYIVTYKLEKTRNLIFVYTF